MNRTRRALFSLGMKDYIYFDFQELLTYLTIVEAMKILHSEGRRKYSMTRLLRLTFKLRPKEFITESKIRRIIVYMLATKPRLIHIRQKGNLRLIFPSQYAIDTVLKES